MDQGETDTTPEDGTPEDGAENHDHGTAFRGLGDYGTDGPIRPEDLPGDLGLRVSDRAIGLAQSPAMSRARKQWDQSTDFVHQVDYQLKIRKDLDYMSSDESHIAQVLVDKPENAGREILGLYMTHAEAAEFERRENLGRRMPRVAELVGRKRSGVEGQDDVHSDNFGGIWQDQLDGGKITVALVNPKKVRKNMLMWMAGGGKNIKVIDVEYSYNEVRQFRRDLYDAIEAGGARATIVVNTTPEGERLEIITPDPGSISESMLSVAPTELVSVAEGPLPTGTGGPTDTHDEADQQPGLQIEFDPGGNCTWGANGHTSNWNYLVTAGHCGDLEDFVGWSDEEEIHQNNVFHLTPGRQFFFSINSDGWDMKRVSSPQADSNCYHADRECRRFFQSRTWHNSWEVGASWVCASLGQTNDYNCGRVLEENYDGGRGGCAGDRYVRFGIETIPGDSGAGIMYPIRNDRGGLGPAATIDGIQSCGNVPDWSYGNTAYDVKTQLGFDFNCAPNAVRGRAADRWGACPVVQRS